LDQRIGQPLLASAIVTDPTLARQRLQRRAQPGAAFGIEPTLEPERSVILRAELEEPVLVSSALILGKADWVLCMARMQTGLAEPGDVLLFGLLQEGRLIEAALPILRGGIGHQGKVAETDLSSLQRLGAERQRLQAESDPDLLAG